MAKTSDSLHLSDMVNHAIKDKMTNITECLNAFVRHMDEHMDGRPRRSEQYHARRIKEPIEGRESLPSARRCDRLSNRFYLPYTNYTVYVIQYIGVVLNYLAIG